MCLCYLQMTQSRALGLMWRVFLTSGLFRYRLEGVELVQGGSRRTDGSSAARLLTFYSERTTCSGERFIDTVWIIG